MIGMEQEGYDNLLAMLQKDLQLDATTDLQAGTVSAAVVNESVIATTATAGAAAALPATPAGYLTIRNGDTIYKLPYYHA